MTPKIGFIAAHKPAEVAFFFPSYSPGTMSQRRTCSMYIFFGPVRSKYAYSGMPYTGKCIALTAAIS